MNGYSVPPVWLMPDLTAAARPRRDSSAGHVWAIRSERRHAVDGDCWCGTVHLAMAGLTLEMLAEFRKQRT